MADLCSVINFFTFDDFFDDFGKLFLKFKLKIKRLYKVEFINLLLYIV